MQNSTKITFFFLSALFWIKVFQLEHTLLNYIGIGNVPESNTNFRIVQNWPYFSLSVTWMPHKSLPWRQLQSPDINQ